MTATFHHFGVPTATKSEDEIYIEGGKVFITEASSHPYKVEFLRFEPDSPMPEEVQTKCHAAFMVDDLEAAISGKKVICQPFQATESLKVAFIMDGDAVIELMQEV